MSSIIADEKIPNAKITADVEKLVYGGDGLARIEGQVLLTPFVLPGERIEVVAERAKAGLLRGTSPQILQQSPERIVPHCEYFGTCGGCQYQHGTYTFQLEAKRSIFRETLQRLGGATYGDEINIVSSEPWHYRNRIQLHFHERRLGYRKAASHALCAITHCPISSPTLNEVIRKLNTAIHEREWPSFLQSLEIFTNEQQIQFNILESQRPVAARFFNWCEGFLPSLVSGTLQYEAAGQIFRVSRGSFFQVNRFLLNELVQVAIGDAQGQQAIDLFAGVGFFSLPLANRFTTVHAVERGGPAYRDLEWNASTSAKNIQPFKTAAEHYLQTLTQAPDFLLVDPPRAGLGPEITKQILNILPHHIAYVSCDPATMARDLRSLMDAYTIAQLTMIDLFPQTYHFESVAQLRRKKSNSLANPAGNSTPLS